MERMSISVTSEVAENQPSVQEIAVVFWKVFKSVTEMLPSVSHKIIDSKFYQYVYDESCRILPVAFTLRDYSLTH